MQYDKKAKSTSLQPGDRVLIRNVKERGGPGKLRSYWEDKVYKIVRQKSNEIPVYEVISKSGGEKTRVLHRNMLFPCTYLPVENPVVKPAQLRTKRRERRRNRSHDYLTDSEDEFEIATFAPELMLTQRMNSCQCRLKMKLTRVLRELYKKVPHQRNQLKRVKLRLVPR